MTFFVSEMLVGIDKIYFASFILLVNLFQMKVCYLLVVFLVLSEIVAGIIISKSLLLCTLSNIFCFLILSYCFVDYFPPLTSGLLHAGSSCLLQRIYSQLWTPWLLECHHVFDIGTSNAYLFPDFLEKPESLNVMICSFQVNNTILSFHGLAGKEALHQRGTLLT